MASSYPLHDGRRVFVSNTTMKNADSSQFCSQYLNIGRCQALLSFTLFDVEHTGANIGQWIEDVHSKVKCVPNFIGSHTVDGAANAGLAVEELKWNTGDQRATKIVSSKCDAHQINTTDKRSSGTSSHSCNHNPVLGKSLTLLHTTLNRVTNSAT